MLSPLFKYIVISHWIFGIIWGLAHVISPQKCWLIVAVYCGWNDMLRRLPTNLLVSGNRMRDWWSIGVHRITRTHTLCKWNIFGFSGKLVWIGWRNFYSHSLPSPLPLRALKPLYLLPLSPCPLHHNLSHPLANPTKTSLPFFHPPFAQPLTYQPLLSLPLASLRKLYKHFYRNSPF